MDVLHQLAVSVMWVIVARLFADLVLAKGWMDTGVIWCKRCRATVSSGSLVVGRWKMKRHERLHA